MPVSTCLAFILYFIWLDLYAIPYIHIQIYIHIWGAYISTNTSLLSYVCIYKYIHIYRWFIFLCPVFPGSIISHQISLYSMYAYTNIYAYIEPYYSSIISVYVNPIFYICIYKYIHIYRGLLVFNSNLSPWGYVCVLPTFRYSFKYMLIYLLTINFNYNI